jgi:phenylacetate-CoA ligase
MREMEKSQYYDLNELKKHQFDRLKKMINHAYKNTTYYRTKFNAYGINPEDIEDENDFKKIPIRSKKYIHDYSDQLISNNHKKESLIPFKTGGSTGKSVTVYYDYTAMEKGVGSSLRSFNWTGWKLGEPIGRVWGNPVLPRTIKEKLRNILIEPQFYLDTMNLHDETVHDFAHEWEKNKPTLLHGHSHSLYMFAQFCKKLNIKDIKPKGIISTSMMLIPSERKVIEDIFECKVTDLYGCEEVGLIGCECEEHNGMHLNMENNYVEFINSQENDTASAEEGAIVVTNLNNKAMPIIRYKIEDVGIPSNRFCKCGRNLPLIERVTGRVADFLVRKDGSLVAGVSLVERTLTAFPGIDQMQIIQQDLDNIGLNIVQGAKYSEATERQLIDEFKEVFGPFINLVFNYVTVIAPERNGKFRFSISKIENTYSGMQ